MRYMIPNNFKLEDIKGFVNKEVYNKLIAKKALVREEDMEFQKSMIRIMCKTKDEEEIKKLMSKLAPYL